MGPDKCGGVLFYLFKQDEYILILLLKTGSNNNAIEKYDELGICVSEQCNWAAADTDVNYFAACWIQLNNLIVLYYLKSSFVQCRALNVL